MNRAKRLLFSILVILTVNGTVFPQTSSTSLQGTITDPSGKARSSALTSCLLATNRSWNAPWRPGRKGNTDSSPLLPGLIR